MAVTATTVVAAATMLAAVAAVFVAFVLCFQIFVCAKRYRDGGGGQAEGGIAARLWFLFGGEVSGGGGGGGAGGDGDAAWCYEGGLDEASIAGLPCREVGKGEALDCAVCITELAAGEMARVLPRCGHGFHVDCVDMWLRSHSTCPLCRCPAVDEPPVPPALPAVQAPEADPEYPIFPTNVLFFGSQDDVSTGGLPAQQQRSPAMATPRTPALSPSPAPAGGVAAVAEAARVRGLRRLIVCSGSAGASPHRQHHASRDIEMGLAGAETSSSRPAKPPPQSS
ncbi:hypothetical protein GUJ93_ZPchr0013g35052 [Zizania palustris]|uniref:RING-type domain-containing protein n=1 Tax=Zizania palustris TaxID=103762 RepID=A0A8J6BYR8_ZIZPA|nr:hypothetical protein GUJ93_ZPchr0013g35052 [Zizania palustris]